MNLLWEHGFLMAKLRSFLRCPKIPSRRFFIKLLVGVFLFTFFLDYQPIFAVPPVKTNQVSALSDNVQSEKIESKDLNISFQLPYPGYLSTPFSNYHPGVDVATGLGMPIKPIASGKIVETGYDFFGLGLNITIDHGQGYKSKYGHLGRIYVNKDQLVTNDSFIGDVGLTGHTSGPHTHIEVYKDEKAIDPKLVLPPLRDYPIATDFIASSSGKLTNKN